MIRTILLACVLAGVAQGAGAFDRDAGWGIGGDACGALAAREAEAEAWIAGYRSALDAMSEVPPVPQASLGFNAVKEFCLRHPERSLVAAARAVFRPRRRQARAPLPPNSGVPEFGTFDAQIGNSRLA